MKAEVVHSISPLEAKQEGSVLCCPPPQASLPGVTQQRLLERSREISLEVAAVVAQLHLSWVEHLRGHFCAGYHHPRQAVSLRLMGERVVHAETTHFSLMSRGSPGFHAVHKMGSVTLKRTRKLLYLHSWVLCVCVTQDLLHGMEWKRRKISLRIPEFLTSVSFQLSRGWSSIANDLLPSQHISPFTFIYFLKIHLFIYVPTFLPKEPKAANTSVLEQYWNIKNILKTVIKPLSQPEISRLPGIVPFSHQMPG